jgi:hypothetical protein
LPAVLFEMVPAFGAAKTSGINATRARRNCIVVKVLGELKNLYIWLLDA